MSATIQLKRMSFSEKIQPMKILWDDICKVPNKLESPLWQLDELNCHQNLIKDGKVEYLDWQDVKQNIRKDIK
jgi:hypothetical protein